MAKGTVSSTDHQNEIWNPWAALFLSAIFTPVFGAMLHGADLRHIGDEEGAAAAWFWERGSMIVLGAAALLQPIAATREGWGLLLAAVDLFLLVLWAAFCGVPHARRISEAERLSKRLVRVSTSRAITVGLLGILAWYALYYIGKCAWELAGVIPEA
ncbi:MAG: hypothetical protein MR009_06340 [Sutterellaceae bacterium]|nr:hypothetical protein [Sutterellaceae bacterium]MDD7441773.1 hypothetical protein [Sutterellaceae bacterium]MDY2868358.1 hypothetical protein [Mesosutterella sp.]